MTDLTPSSTRSADGTVIGIQSIGSGPELLIVHGAMQSGESQRELAELLSDRFRVHLMDRRGRGLSGPYPTHPGTALEVDDVRAVVAATGARRVLGISSGAILSARTALVEPQIEQLVLFEPPLSIAGSMRIDRADGVETAVARGDLGTAMGLGMKVGEMGPPWMFGLPVPLLALVSRRMLRSDPRAAPMARALGADYAIVRENADRIEQFAGIRARTLVINGTSTRPYLRGASEAVAAVIPGARRVQLDGQSHGVTQNAKDWGRPQLVAPVLREFFGA